MTEGLLNIDSSAVRKPRPVGLCQWAFPDPRGANALGLVARGGDFEPETILEAYRNGIFPWPHEDEDFLWFSPARRAVIPAGGLHISRRLRRSLRKGVFTASLDRRFAEVMAACADREEGTWITPEYQRGFRKLHELGWAHSVETWNAEGKLAGGLYGVAVGGLFAAESMFYRVDDASKAALVALMAHLEARGFLLVDVQLPTPHLERMGAITISRGEYLASIGRAVRLDVTF